ncbi:UNVERIFIED_CONTAM: hypothetical protein FKN15_061228 [Acipenser sinensis]
MFHFKFVNHGNSLLQKMNLLREQDCFCDVALQIHNFTFQGHKVVLAASSPFLRDQFLLNSSREVSISVLHSSEIGRQLLLSCYTGILEFPVKQLVNCLTAASALQMSHVVEWCAQAVSQYLDPTLTDIKGVMTFNEVQPCSPSSDGDKFQETVDGFDMDSSKVFQHLENYISHVKEHRLYLCLRCGKTFSQKSNLTRHIRVHTGMKPFECPLCKKAFSQKATLQDHVNLHTGIKPHKCNYCAVHFAHKPGLRRHLKDVHRKSSLENTCEKVDALIVDSD